MKKAAIVYGLGGGWFDPDAGERLLVNRLKAIGIDTGKSPYLYHDSQGVYDHLFAADLRVIVGDSLGACNTPQFAASLNPHRVDYIAGFQPSWYGAHVPVPANVVRAHCIYDPHWIDTGGLGAYRWELASGNKTTRLMVTEHRGAHPDDYGYSQDLVFAEIKGLIA